MQFSVIIHLARLTIPVRWGKSRTCDVRPDMSCTIHDVLLQPSAPGLAGAQEWWRSVRPGEVMWWQWQSCQFMSYPTCAHGACWMISWPQQEGVPREWWAIEPRFFQPKASPMNKIRTGGSDSPILPWSMHSGKVLGAVPEESWVILSLMSVKILWISGSLRSARRHSTQTRNLTRGAAVRHHLMLELDWNGRKKPGKSVQSEHRDVVRHWSVWLWVFMSHVKAYSIGGEIKFSKMEWGDCRSSVWEAALSRVCRGETKADRGRKRKWVAALGFSK